MEGKHVSGQICLHVNTVVETGKCIAPHCPRVEIINHYTVSMGTTGLLLGTCYSIDSARPLMLNRKADWACTALVLFTCQNFLAVVSET